MHRPPSRAKRMAVARPLPIVSPGVWPAPTTMATLSFSLIRKPFKPLFQLDPTTVQRHRYQRVLPGRENQIQELLGVVAPSQRLPCRITDKRVSMQLVNSPQQRSFERVPSGSIRPRRDTPNIIGTKPHLLSNSDMMAPFILRPAQPSHAEDHHLPLSRGKRRLGKGVVSKYQPSLKKLQMPRQRRENVVHVPIHLQALEDLSSFSVPLSLRKRRNARLLQPHS